ncbi:hypothetical protein Tco_0971835 [Tanacetum coccineum]
MKQRGSSKTGSLFSSRVDLTGDEDPSDEDGDVGIGDLTRVLVSLGDEISSGGNKSQNSLVKLSSRASLKIIEPGFELKALKRVEMGRTPRNGASGLQDLVTSPDYCSWDSLGSS